MTGAFDSLLCDLENLWSSSLSPSDEDLKEFSDNVSKAIVSSLSRFSSDAKTEEPRVVLRMSNIGKPARQLWYQHKDKRTEKDVLPYSLLLKFLYGELLEELLVRLIKTAGHSVEERQKEHKVDGVLGHQDARVDGVLVDFKSASGRSFLKFKNYTLFDDDPFGYIGQLSGYAQEANDEMAAFVVIDKVSGEIAIMPIHRLEMIDVKQRVSYLKNTLKKEDPPEKCYPDQEDGKSGNRKLAIGCAFCSYKIECWADANGGKGLRGFRFSNGIRYLTQVARTPEVSEVDVSV